MDGRAPRNMSVTDVLWQTLSFARGEGPISAGKTETESEREGRGDFNNIRRRVSSGNLENPVAPINKSITSPGG